MIFEFKNHKVSNSLNVFNYYKGATGRSLESDIRKMKKLDAVMSDPEATEAEIEAAHEAMPIDLFEVIQHIYYAMRCAAERKELDFMEIINEVDISDLADGTLQAVIMQLVEVKKKEVVRTESRNFLNRRKK